MIEQARESNITMVILSVNLFLQSAEISNFNEITDTRM